MLTTALLLSLSCSEPPGEAALSSERSSPASSPDLILIAGDTLRADRLGSYGHWRRTDPNLEEWLSRGVRFEQALAPAPWTLPSVATLLTGRQPWEHGLERPDQELTGETLAERLRREGYETIFLGVNAWFQQPRGLERGFDQFQAFTGLDGRQLNRRLEAVLGERRGEQPIFLYLHYFDPHCPYQAPRDLLGRLGGPDPARDPGRELPELPGCYRLAGEGEPQERTRADYLLRYDEELLQLDRVWAEALELLQRYGYLDRARVILTGDHGEDFFEHGSYGHGSTLWQTSLWVPLWVLDFPAQASGVRSAPVTLMDVAPSLLAAARLSTEGLPGLRVMDARPSRLLRARLRHEGRLEAVLQDGWKLITSEGEVQGLFELSTDPAEERDRRHQEPERVESLLLELPSAQEGPSVGRPPDDLKLLRSMGYLAPESEPVSPSASEPSP